MQSDQSELGTFWILKDAKFLHVNNENSNQTVQMSLHWVHMSEGIFSHIIYSQKGLHSTKVLTLAMNSYLLTVAFIE